MPSVLAAQMYTLRNVCKTPADIAASIKKVKNIGYDAVQLSGMGPIEPAEMARILKGEGMTCCATHENFDRMQKEPQAIIDSHGLWGCKYTCPGSMPNHYATRQGYSTFAVDATEVARKLKQGGLTWGYHNHAFEFEKFDGKIGLDIFYSQTDPKLITAEIDTYWVQYGGGDPAAWIRKLKGRIPLVHFKDMAFGHGVDAMTRKEGESDAQFNKRSGVWGMEPIMAEIGEGNLNWPEIIKACREAGVIWYIVEQDVCRRDPFESLAISLRNLRAMGIN